MITLSFAVAVVRTQLVFHDATCVFLYDTIINPLPKLAEFGPDVRYVPIETVKIIILFRER